MKTDTTMVKAIAGFRSFPTHHCETGSMRHIYAFNGHDTSEDMLLGLGEGVGFCYFRFKGQLPFLGGRAQPKPGMEEISGKRTGVTVAPHASSSDAAAEKSLLSRLTDGLPVMLQVDMGFLPYFDFGGEPYHFGGHVVVACGLDRQAGSVLIADRDGLHPVPLEALAAARGSRHKPFPPGRRWWEFDFSGFRPPRVDEAREAVANQADLMLSPPIANLGVKGIRKAAGEIGEWDTILGHKELGPALMNVWIFVSETGGSGGGLFRFMLSRFLREAGRLFGLEAFVKAGEEFDAVAREWDRVGLACKEAYGAGSRASMTARLPEVSRLLLSVADREEAAWKHAAETARE